MGRLDLDRAICLRMEDGPAGVLRIDSKTLVDSIHRAFLDSRFSVPHGARYVNIHADGTVVVSRTGLSVHHSGSSIIALECLGAPEFPGHALSMAASWTHDEYLAWVSSRPDLYLEPILDELRHQAKRRGIQVELIDPIQ